MYLPLLAGGESMGEKWFALLSDRRAQTLDDTPRGQRALSAISAEGGNLGPPAQRSSPEPMSAKKNKMRRAITIVIMRIIILIVVIVMLRSLGRGGISTE